MNLYIRVENNEPFGHPITLSNFIQAFPHIDLNNLPSDFAVFKFTEPPVIGVYEVYENTTYKWDNGVIKNAHIVRPMTENEILEKQNLVKAQWADSGYPSWTFDEVSCSFKPPEPYPTDKKPYWWDEKALRWVLYERTP